MLPSETFESTHDKTNKMVPVHSVVAKDPNFLHADSEDSDQTEQMPRLM